MSSKKWFLTWLGLSVLIFACVGLINLYIDPYKVFNWEYRHSFVSERSAFLSKMTRLENYTGLECLILGSSRAELLQPSQASERSQLKTFTAALGGAMTYSKYAFGMKALDNKPDLKEIWYFSDFYEFNEKKIPWSTYRVEQGREYFLKDELEDVVPNSEYFQTLISLKTLRASIKTIKEMSRESESAYLDDGSTKISIVKLSFNDLILEMKMNFLFYKLSRWNGFKALSEKSKWLIDDMIRKANDKSVIIKVVLTPIHPELMRKLESELGLKKLWDEWRDFWRSRSSKTVKIYDYTESEKYWKSDSTGWNDGVHFSPEATQMILEDLVGESNH